MDTNIEESCNKTDYSSEKEDFCNIANDNIDGNVIGKNNDECKKIPEKKSKQRHIECNSDCDHTIQKVNKKYKFIYLEIM